MRASAVMAAGTMVSRVLGLVKVMMLTAAIGSVGSISADAFQAGNLLPNTLYIILLGGMLNAVLVPQIVRAAQAPDGGSAYINKVLTLVCTVLFAVTVLAMILAPAIVWLTVQNWSEEQLALATAFAYWCLPQIVFYGLYTVLGEVLNARSVFGPFTWAPVVNNLIGIAGVGLFLVLFGGDGHGTRVVAEWTPDAIAVLGGSATLGVTAQALILFVAWRRAGIRYRPDFAWRGMGLGQTVRVAGWSLAMIVVIQLGGIVTNRVVSTGTGYGPSLNAMQNVWLVFMMPHSVIAVSLATAYFTRLSEWGQSGRMAQFRDDLSASARQISVVMILAAAALFAAAPFASRVMNPAATTVQVEQFSAVLQAYLPSLAAYSFLFVVQRAFFALSDTRTPFLVTTAQMAVVVAGSLLLLVVPKTQIGLFYALLWSLATLGQAALATWMLRRKIGSLDGRRIAATLVRSLLAVLPALAIGLLAGAVLGARDPAQPPLLAALLALLVMALVSFVYLGGLALLRSPELHDLAAFAARRLGRKRS